ncbi:hypothetical protein GVN21_13050 [Caulobacter sp. SLTY]|uniref:EH signature domain-containing protein n=1 Tax=Caulobacter sp. SLTY TaxID=2683262 RepID=UPI00141280B8|nr:EH signature domain-containing protein [Caulobacter sp. SLTY]NBB16287.1 hypothetical protein [Caulobacter sp. SLTY]
MTTSLQSLLGRPDALSLRLKVEPIEPKLLQRKVEQMKGLAGSALPPEAIEILQGRIHRVIASEGPQALSRRDLRDACAVFVSPPHPIVGEAVSADAIMSEVGRTGRLSALLGLIAAYIDGFIQDAAFHDFAARLRKLLKTWRGKPVPTWLELDRTISFFEPDKVPQKIAAAVLGSDRPAGEILRKLGLDSPIRLHGGLAEAAFIAAAKIVASRSGPSVIPLQEKLAEWATGPHGGFAFPKSLPLAIDALLLPWLKEDPPNDHRAMLLDRVQGFGGGDPRTKPAGWAAVRSQAPQAFGVMMRWLTRASVFQFFDIVDRSLARDPEARRMWDYRRRFWTSYLLGTDGAPTIEEAWVAFGAEGAHLARRAARENNDASLGSFGTQEDRSPTHAALIMRIGDLVIVDWSHNSKCNFWHRGDKKAPALYQSRYPAGTLYSSREQLSHSAPASFSWQKSFAQVIEGKAFWSERPSWRLKRV